MFRLEQVEIPLVHAFTIERLVNVPNRRFHIRASMKFLRFLGQEGTRGGGGGGGKGGNEIAGEKKEVFRGFTIERARARKENL